ncbi:MAG: isochorismatase family protein [Hyphomonadaceae bacterium]|nr:isochorismatase family protein [Hyphomonadaceae bacterium]
MFPWSDVVSPTDLAAFARPPAPLEGPMRAGRAPALLIVDMTRMFVDGAYPSGCAPASAGAVKANAQLLQCAREAKLPVFFTKAYADPLHEPTDAEKGLWKHGRLDVPGLPPGDVIIEELAPAPGETIVCKGSKPSAFFGTPLAAMLIALGVDTLIVTGISTSGCVRATALDGFQHNFHVVIPHEATADRCAVSHKVNLFDLHMKYAHVATTEAALAYMREQAKR